MKVLIIRLLHEDTHFVHKVLRDHTRTVGMKKDPVILFVLCTTRIVIMIVFIEIETNNIIAYNFSTEYFRTPLTVAYCIVNSLPSYIIGFFKVIKR